jgi:chaperonin cofactor prefoldin
MAATLLSLGAACASNGAASQTAEAPKPLAAPAAGPPAETVMAPPVFAQSATPAPRESAPEPEQTSAPTGKTGEIALGSDSSGVTAELARTREALVMSRTMNTRLQRQIEDLKGRVAEKDARIARLELQVEEFSNRANTLEEKLTDWQKDVLGFRDEIRDMNRAQAQILEKIVVLLQDLEAKPEKPATTEK